ncbi:MAG TPA: hypothetical protein DHV48_03520 [Prolixibacteraceae bacterium]|nr:hypothetical protein [Prolixibacteraceae bacterium]
MKNLFYLLLITLIGCSTQQRIPDNTGYLMSVETAKPHEFTIHKFMNSCEVDSIITREYGFAFTGFKSDSIFQISPYFKMESLNKVVYGEEREIFMRNGKVKFRKLRNR